MFFFQTCFWWIRDKRSLDFAIDGESFHREDFVHQTHCVFMSNDSKYWKELRLYLYKSFKFCSFDFVIDLFYIYLFFIFFFWFVFLCNIVFFSISSFYFFSNHIWCLFIIFLTPFFLFWLVFFICDLDLSFTMDK